jgi:hypothetical protein
MLGTGIGMVKIREHTVPCDSRRARRFETRVAPNWFILDVYTARFTGAKTE